MPGGLLAILLAAGCVPPVDDAAADTEVAEAAPPSLLPRHRLGHTEIRHTLSDVLGIDLDVAGWLPQDDGHYGFDHLDATTQTTSTFVEAWLRFAESTAERAVVGASTPSPTAIEIQHPARQLPWSAGAPVALDEFLTSTLWALDEPGSVRFVVPEDGIWQVEVSLNARLPSVEAVELVVSVDDEVLGSVFATEPAPSSLELVTADLALTRGEHTLSVDFTAERAAEPDWVAPPEVLVDDDLLVLLYSLRVSGEAAAVPTANPADRVLDCDGHAPGSPACVTARIDRLVPRLWRRPVTTAEHARLLGVYDAARAADGTDAQGMVALLTAVLGSPSFLYRLAVPHGTRDEDGTDLGPWSVAARLSYGLWMAPPDDALAACAAAGGLAADDTGSCGLRAQAERMLADPRSEVLATQLVLRWLGVHRNVSFAIPEANFPRTSPELVQAQLDETVAMVNALRADDRDLRDLLTVSTSTVSASLGALYGVPDLPLTTLSTIDLASVGRQGVLTLGSTLLASSRGGDPSDTDRGVWVLEHLLCSPPPPPPPFVDTQPPEDGDLDAHLTNARCRACHATIDPVGAPLRGYDTLGEDVAPEARSEPVELPDGERVSTLAEYADWLIRQETLTRCFAQRVSTFVLGEDVPMADDATVDDVQAAALAEGFSLDDLVLATVMHPRFTASLEVP